ncbi:MAG: hypothetical protein ACE5K0_04745 [Candidatus Methanofastidiosia archaeon]
MSEKEKEFEIKVRKTKDGKVVECCGEEVARIEERGDEKIIRFKKKAGFCVCC